jgi:hypothetical protein
MTHTLLDIIKMTPITAASYGGFTLGTVVAVALSWSRNKSILWAILHGILSWMYVLYYITTNMFSSK